MICRVCCVQIDMPAVNLRSKCVCRECQHALLSPDEEYVDLAAEGQWDNAVRAMEDRNDE